MRNKSRISLEELKVEIHTELRTIVKQKRYLSSPICHFQEISRKENKPKFRVVFDKEPPREINSIITRSPSITLPEERIINDVLNRSFRFYNNLLFKITTRYL